MRRHGLLSLGTGCEGVAAVAIGCVLVLAVTLSGCASTEPNIASEDELRQVSEEESIVSGRIDWFEHGEKQEFGSGMFSSWVAPHLIRLEDEERIIGRTDDTGRFVWSLEPGSYVMYKLEYRDTWSGNYFVAPHVAFAVPESGMTYYVGVLDCRFEPERDFLGHLSGSATFRVLDEMSADAAHLQNRFHLASGSIERSLMVHEARLPATIDSNAELRAAVTIFNTILGGASH